MVVTIAHLSDPHLAPMAAFSLGHLRTKRLLGYLNWQRNRKAAHLRPVLEQLVLDLLEQAPDHIAVTGDLVNIGLPVEHVGALAWLRQLGPEERVTVVPGNHDIYVRMRRDPGAMRWRSYMTGAGETPQEAAPAFPFVRRLGDVALIGLNSALPRPPFIASGRIGRAQLDALQPLLVRLGGEGLCRVVLVHHPPLPGQAPRSRALEDANQLADVLRTGGAELVLHGHNHQASLVWCERAGGLPRIPVVGVPSASIGIAHHDALARYNLVRIEKVGTRWALNLLGRGLAEPGGGVVELERLDLADAAPVR
ncbi:MAG: metallophosphoesterase [Hyphomicrobiaceae bacterium]|nr:metallophosphoesterase [Hyphomicrobiaceae bacterium]